MAGVIAPSLPTFGISYDAVTARNAEYTGNPLTDGNGDGSYADPYLGCNRGGSNAPGIGIATSIVQYEITADVRRNNWTITDQAGDQRIPQDTQHIGGIIDTAPAYEGVEYPTPAEAGKFPARVALGAAVDYNNTANFVVADVAAVDGAEMDTASGAINNTGATVAIGNVIWGQAPVA